MAWSVKFSGNKAKTDLLFHAVEVETLKNYGQFVNCLLVFMASKHKAFLHQKAKDEQWPFRADRRTMMRWLKADEAV